MNQIIRELNARTPAARVNAAVNGNARRTAADTAVLSALRRVGRWLAVSGQ